MNLKIQTPKKASSKPGPFNQAYVPINVKTNTVTGAVTLSIEGTGTVVIGTDLTHAGVRLLLAYNKDIEKSFLIAMTLEHSYGF